ncbi:MAG: cupin domain-containing protein [Pseudomonadota bacterium]
MELNADFTQRVLLHADELPWQPSPMAGVERRMLDRLGDEVARATTIVRYAPGSRFSAHTHGGGEEFIVLDGVFQDEHGDFPAGAYVRNPPTSRHTPGSAPGCVIFVKLWQFAPDDRTPVMVDMNKMGAVDARDRAGVSVTPLFEDDRESVRVERWDARQHVSLALPGGGEFLVLDGAFTESSDALTKHSWLRLPPGARLDAVAGEGGARVWVKSGHLPFASAPALGA